MSTKQLDVDAPPNGRAVAPPRESLVVLSLRIALSILADRALLWAVHASCFALFAYTAWQPVPLRLLTASLYTLLIYGPMAVRRARSTEG